MAYCLFFSEDFGLRSVLSHSETIFAQQTYTSIVACVQESTFAPPLCKGKNGFSRLFLGNHGIGGGGASRNLYSGPIVARKSREKNVGFCFEYRGSCLLLSSENNEISARAEAACHGAAGIPVYASTSTRFSDSVGNSFTSKRLPFSKCSTCDLPRQMNRNPKDRAHMSMLPLYLKHQSASNVSPFYMRRSTTRTRGKRQKSKTSLTANPLRVQCSTFLPGTGDLY